MFIKKFILSVGLLFAAHLWAGETNANTFDDNRPDEASNKQWSSLKAAVQEAKLLPSGTIEDVSFVYSVSLWGNRALIGPYREDTSSGAAYIFEYDGSSWLQTQKLTASDGAAGAFFGISVSLNGDRALIGADNTDGVVASTGAAYIFDYDGSSWSQTQKLTALDESSGDNFGISVSLNGNRALIGADRADGVAVLTTGAAYVFDYDGSSWSQIQKLTAFNGLPFDYFGFSVSLSGDKILIGAYGVDNLNGGFSPPQNIGRAYTFNYTGSSWTRGRYLEAGGDHIPENNFGYSVSLSGNRALIGTPFDDDRGTDSGSASVFQFDDIFTVSANVTGLTTGNAVELFNNSGDNLILGRNGTEIRLNQRDPMTNVTVLSGDIEQNDINSDGNHILENRLDIVGSNSYHIVNGSGVDSSTVFSGFTVTAGQADGVDGSPERYGAGMYCGNNFTGPSISESTFIGNTATYDGAATYGCSQLVADSNFINNHSRHGGAIRIRGGDYENVLFQGNTTDGFGGAIYKNASPLKIVNSQFIANQAIGNGGAISTVAGVTLENVLFSGNKSSGLGGAISQLNSTSNLTNVTMTGNFAAGSGGAINVSGATFNLRNSIIWNNHDSTTDTTAASSINLSSTTYTQTNSLVQNFGTSGVGNLDVDPLLSTDADPTAAPSVIGNARLQLSSLAIDAGDNDFVAVDSKDLDDSDRIFNGVVDMGAYEYSGSNTVSVTVNGLDAGSLILQNKGTDDLTFDNDGTQVFMTPLTLRDNYLVTVFSQPTFPSQLCEVINPTGIISDAIIVVNVNCTDSYNVGIKVFGLADGVTLSVLNNSELLDVTSNDPTNFASEIIHGGAYAVSVETNPSNPNQECLIVSTNASGTINGQDVMVVIECTTLQYNVGVDVFGLADGNTLSVMNNSETMDLTSNGTTNFPTTLDDGSAYAVSVTSNPSNPSQTCLITSNNASGFISGGEIEVTIQCAATQYNVGVDVSGLASGNTLGLDNSGEGLVVSSNGLSDFAAGLDDLSGYTVSITSQPTSPSQACEFTSLNQVGIISGADVTIDIECTTNSYFIGGNVTGLISGNYMLIQNNIGDDKIITKNGTYIFSTPILDHEDYDVTIELQPDDPIQLCMLSNEAGSLDGNDIGIVDVECEFGDDMIYRHGFEEVPALFISN